jgi:hypothetical protein
LPAATWCMSHDLILDRSRAWKPSRSIGQPLLRPVTRRQCTQSTWQSSTAKRLRWNICHKPECSSLRAVKYSSSKAHPSCVTRSPSHQTHISVNTSSPVHPSLCAHPPQTPLSCFELCCLATINFDVRRSQHTASARAASFTHGHVSIARFNRGQQGGAVAPWCERLCMLSSK